MKPQTLVPLLALQMAMRLDGSYQTKGKTLNDCPIPGIYGLCIRAELKQFQTAHDITGNDSVAGPQTLRVLDELYGFGNRE